MGTNGPLRSNFRPRGERGTGFKPRSARTKTESAMRKVADSYAAASKPHAPHVALTIELFGGLTDNTQVDACHRVTILGFQLAAYAASATASSEANERLQAEVRPAYDEAVNRLIELVHEHELATAS